MDLKKTPLNEEHYKLGATMVDFGGWDMPVQYTGIIEEHLAVRNSAGLFDVSHMGEIIVKGSDATKYINYLISSNIEGLVTGQIKYGVLMMDNGYAVDDLLVYKYKNTHYLVVVNASNTDKDFKWFKDHIGSFDVSVENKSNDYGEIALQGPKSIEILKQLTKTDIDKIDYYYFEEGKVCGLDAIISRTGYTGEDGFEIYTKSEDAPKVWREILKVGGSDILPCGLGCRDTLRFEAKMPLYGHELSDSISPLETGLGRFVELDKDEFIGKSALAKMKEEGRKRKVVGLEMIGRGVAREGFEVLKEGVKVGYITTGSPAPTFKKNLGLALVSMDVAVDDKVFVKIRNKEVEAKIVKTPFYKREK